MIEFDALKNFCSVNYSLKGLISFAQAHVVSNMVLNGNVRETLGACTGQMRHFRE